jgi:tRNA-specific 2-thiouridylase
VVRIEPATRTVVVGPREALASHAVTATDVNWLVDPAPREGDRVQVRVRHRAPLVDATIVHAGAGRLEVALDDAIVAVAPGQSLVLYDGDVVLGGGVIDAGVGAGTDGTPPTRARRLPVLRS